MNHPENGTYTENTDDKYGYGAGAFTEEIYSDANFSPCDNVTMPPRYYSPAEKPVKNTRNEKTAETGAKEHESPFTNRKGINRVIVLCLLSAVLGGLFGSSITEYRLTHGLAHQEEPAVETQLPDTAEKTLQSAADAETAAAVQSTGAFSGERPEIFLGIYPDPAYSPVFAHYYELPDGVYISGIEPGSPAETAGLMPGDIITAFAGLETESLAGLPEAMRQCRPDMTYGLSFFRDGEYINVDISPVSAPESTDGNVW